MAANNKGFQTVLYSAIGVAAIALVLVAANFILGLVKVRVDLTQDRAYTLSPGTRAILAQLDTPVKVRFYYTQGEQTMPVMLKGYAQRIEDLLGEYKQAGRGKLVIEKFDPVPDSDAEDSAKLDGVEGQPLQTGDEIYLGLAVSCLDQKVAIPFLSPDRERSLEYDLSRAISTVTKSEKPVIGVMTALPMFGQQMNPMMMQMGRQGGSPPWILINELKRDFTVKQVELTADKIDDDIKVLVAVHPKDLSEKTQFAIDQFILRGGKLIAFLDPRSSVDSRSQQNPMMGGFGASSASSLGKLLDAWGLQFDISKVVADRQYVTRIMNQARPDRPQAAPAILSLTSEAVDRNDVVTGQVDSLLMWCAGAFTGTPVEGLTQTVLLKSSTESQLVDAMTAEMAHDQIIRDFKPSGKEYPLAVRLTGKFKTAFPKGAPEEKKPEGAEPDKDKQPEAKPAEGFKESKQETSVILVGDSDMLFDSYCVDVQNVFGQQIVIPRNGNLTLAQGFVEQLAGDSNLISVRSRATLSRPFTLVKKMQALAEDRYMSKIKSMEEKLQEAQRRLNDLQQNKEKGQRFILSPEQQAEIEKFRAEEAKVKQELKLERRNLRQDIDSLENRLKWVNIAGMPLAVTATGIALAMMKRKRTAAK